MNSRVGVYLLDNPGLTQVSLIHWIGGKICVKPCNVVPMACYWWNLTPRELGGPQVSLKWPSWDGTFIKHWIQKHHGHGHDMSWSLSLLNDFIVVLQFSPVHWIVWDVNLCVCVLRSLFFLWTNCIETRHGCTAGQVWPSLTLKAEEKVFSCDTTQSKTMGSLDETWRKRVNAGKLQNMMGCPCLQTSPLAIWRHCLLLSVSSYTGGCKIILPDNDFFGQWLRKNHCSK